MHKLSGDNITTILVLLIVGLTVVATCGVYRRYDYDQYQQEARSATRTADDLRSENFNLRKDFDAAKDANRGLAAQINNPNHCH